MKKNNKLNCGFEWESNMGCLIGTWSYKKGREEFWCSVVNATERS